MLVRDIEFFSTTRDQRSRFISVVCMLNRRPRLDHYFIRSIVVHCRRRHDRNEKKRGK